MTETDFPSDENGDALRHMAEQGVNLTASHKLDFELVFPDEAAAKKFESLAAGLVLESTCHGPDEEDPDQEWEVQCRVRMVPTHEEITAMEAKFEELAEEAGGYSDGWGLVSNADGSPAD